jgi:hypothetical protein
MERASAGRAADRPGLCWADVRPRRGLHAQALGAALLVGEPPPELTERLQLRWEAPEGCPDQGDALERVTRFLGRPPGQADDPHVRATVRIAERKGLFVAELDLADDDGQRRLEAERCEVVADAAAYVVATMIDPMVELPMPEADPGAAADTAPVAEPAPPPGREPAVVRERRASPTPRDADRRRIRGALRVGPAIGVGPLPSVAPGIGGGAALLLHRLRIELLAAHWFARPARLADRLGVGGDIDLTTGAVRVCPVAMLRPVEIPLCAGFELGSMHGRGVGISDPAEARLLWAAFSAGAGLVWMPAQRVGLWLDTALVVPVSRPVFSAENVGRVHQPAAAAFSGMMGVEVRFF